jgi:hypothetical protein
MAFGEGVDVQIRQNQIVFIHFEARDFVGGDGTENTIVFHGMSITCFGRRNGVKLRK